MIAISVISPAKKNQFFQLEMVLHEAEASLNKITDVTLLTLQKISTQLAISYVD